MNVFIAIFGVPNIAHGDGELTFSEIYDKCYEMTLLKTYDHQNWTLLSRFQTAQS